MITRRRIRNVEAYLSSLSTNQVFRVVYRQPIDEKLLAVGFSQPFDEQQKVLPKIIKSVSRFNSIGGFKIHRDQPKETVYRELELTDWHGNTHFVDVPYQRYPRTSIPPPSIEIELIKGQQGLMVISPELVNIVGNYQIIKHTINLFLELFGECELVSQSLIPILSPNTKRVNWEILPRGQYPWSRLQQHIDEKLNILSDGIKRVVENRFRLLSSFSPEFIAQGRAGFYGYVIFGFESKNLYILESIFHGNATYVLGNDWETIAQLTKKEILDDDLHQGRFIHGRDWIMQINRLLQ